jgi:TRAP-type C4-dicarboxylate transport system substrate-binding protein
MNLAQSGLRNFTWRKALTCAGVAAASLGLVAVASAQDIKLTFADQNSPTGWGPAHALYPWVKQVEEATKGRVKIDVYPSQTLIKGVDMWKGVRSGIADIGWCVQGYWPEQTPLSDVISLPFLPFKSAEQGSAVFWQLYEKFPAIQKEFGDIVPLVLYVGSPNLLITNKKAVKTLDDFKGLKVRILGGPPTEMAKALGAVPTLIPMPDMYQALDKGVVDAGAVPWEAVHGFRLYEVGKYYTLAPFYVAYFSVCANKQKIASLPKDVRDQIMSVSGLAGAKFWGRNFFDTAEDGVMEKVKSGNYEMNRYQVPPDEVARWSKIAGQPLWEEWVKKMEAKGHKEAREILNTTLELLKN